MAILIVVPLGLVMQYSMIVMLWFGLTLQLIAHMALFNTKMPPEVIVFLKKMLDMVRFNPSNSTIDGLNLSVVYTTAGYGSSRFTENMSMLMWISLLVTASLALILLAKDAFLMKSCQPRGARRIRWTSCPSTATFIAIACFTLFFASFEMFVCSLIELVHAEEVKTAPVVIVCLAAAFLSLGTRYYKFGKRYTTKLWAMHINIESPSKVTPKADDEDLAYTERALFEKQIDTEKLDSEANNINQTDTLGKIPSHLKEGKTYEGC